MEEETGFHLDMRACFLRAVRMEEEQHEDWGPTDSSGAIGLLTKTRAVLFEAC